MIQLEKSDWLDDWYVLEMPSWWYTGTPEGTADEWRAIINAISEKRNLSFKRVGVWFDDDKVCHFYSPRNSIEMTECRLPTDKQADFVSQAHELLNREYQVNIKWDNETHVFVATSDDIEGLVTESQDIFELVEKIKTCAAELTGDDDCRIKAVLL